MDLEEEFESEHLFFDQRKCRVCGETKDLLTDYYMTRKGKKYLTSSYSYECKDCTIKRIVVSRMKTKVFDKWEYPDW